MTQLDQPGLERHDLDLHLLAGPQRLNHGAKHSHDVHAHKGFVSDIKTSVTDNSDMVTKTFNNINHLVNDYNKQQKNFK